MFKVILHKVTFHKRKKQEQIKSLEYSRKDLAISAIYSVYTRIFSSTPNLWGSVMGKLEKIIK